MNEEQKNVLTDEDVEQLRDIAKSVNVDNESISKLHEAKEKSLDELLDEEKDDKNIGLSINAKTGLPEGSSILTGYGFNNDSDLFESFSNGDNRIDADFNKDNIKNALSGEIMKTNDHAHENLSDDDLSKIKIVLDLKNKKGSINYNDLPEVLKKDVDKTVKASMGFGFNRSQLGLARNMIANEIIENLYTALLQEKINEVTVDLEASIKNLVGKEYRDIAAAQQKQQAYVYMKKLPELAETKFKDNHEKKALINAVVDGYKQAYSLEKMYSAYSKGGKQMRVRKIDVEKIYKLIREFETKYEKSTFTIRDINHAIDILPRHINARYNEQDVKALIAVFCKYTQNMTPSNVADHTFMYYFINNILSLDIPVTDKDAIAYNEKFIENINHMLGLIKEKMNNN